MRSRQVLTDRPPFHEHSDPTTIALILKGQRPQEPIFDTTRGYTRELWEMTTSCWKEDPSGRPTADYVLGVLRSAAEQWESKHRGDGQGSTFTKKSDSGPRTTPDEEVDRILVGVKSPLGKGGVRKAVETLEKVSKTDPLFTRWCIQPADDRCWSPKTR